VPRERDQEPLAGELSTQLQAFGANMRSARRQAGLTQQELSRAARLDRAAISFIERAQRAPDLGTLLRIARALDTTPGELLRDIGVSTASLRGPRDGSLSKDAAGRFGANLRWARARAAVSQETLALEANVDRAAISVYEHGRREPNLRTVMKLADALEVSPAVLLVGVK
jgi:transcriptional regulator with XRE-family HTH domain